MDSEYPGKLYYDSGELKYEGLINNNMPQGQGTRYFKNGHKHMEGQFEDWFIVEGKEYYEHGILRYEGRYNNGPRNYYGPRYFVEGQLYYETGEIWYKGTFFIEKRGNLGFPLFKGKNSFLVGTEYHKDGQIIKIRKNRHGLKIAPKWKLPDEISQEKVKDINQLVDIIVENIRTELLEKGKTEEEVEYFLTRFT